MGPLQGISNTGPRYAIEDAKSNSLENASPSPADRRAAFGPASAISCRCPSALQPQAAILRSIELLGTVVARKVRAELAFRRVLAPPLVRAGAQAQRWSRSGTADGRRSCLSVVKVSNHLASRLGRGRGGRDAGNRVGSPGEDCAQGGERTIVVAVAGSVARCVWRLGGYSRRALRVHLLRDGRRCRCEGANRGRRQ
jgi:hypothetical protein